jgi:hypothetical protein
MKFHIFFKENSNVSWQVLGKIARRRGHFQVINTSTRIARAINPTVDSDSTGSIPYGCIYMWFSGTRMPSAGQYMGKSIGLKVSQVELCCARGQNYKGSAFS